MSLNYFNFLTETDINKLLFSNCMLLRLDSPVINLCRSRTSLRISSLCWIIQPLRKRIIVLQLFLFFFNLFSSVYELISYLSLVYLAFLIFHVTLCVEPNVSSLYMQHFLLADANPICFYPLEVYFLCCQEISFRCIPTILNTFSFAIIYILV